MSDAEPIFFPPKLIRRSSMNRTFFDGAILSSSNSALFCAVTATVDKGIPRPEDIGWKWWIRIGLTGMEKGVQGVRLS